MLRRHRRGGVERHLPRRRCPLWGDGELRGQPGEARSSTNANGTTTTYSYNAANQLTSVGGAPALPGYDQRSNCPPAARSPLTKSN